MSINKIICLLLATILVTQCAGVRFYSDEGLTKKTGIKYYTAKPYLLVSRSGQKDKPIQTTIIHLPDMEHPYFAKYSPGIGSHEFSLKLDGGVLTDFGQKADSKIPELLGALNTLQLGLAEAAKIRAETEGLREEAVDRKTLEESAQQLMKISEDLNEFYKKAKDQKLSFTEDQEKTKKSLILKLQSISSRLKDPRAIKNLPKIITDLKGVKDNWDKLLKKGSEGDQSLTRYNGNINTLKEQIERIIKKLDPPRSQAEQTVFELYEIKQKNGVTELIPVKIQDIKYLKK